MKRFQKIVAMALAATLAVPGSVLSTFASARVEEAGSFFTSFEDGEEWSDSFKANTLEKPKMCHRPRRTGWLAMS